MAFSAGTTGESLEKWNISVASAEGAFKLTLPRQFALMHAVNMPLQPTSGGASAADFEAMVGAARG